MKNSVQPSFSIDSVLANLSESTEIDCSEDGTQFSEMIQKYQNETQTIQSILNSLYQQFDKSISSTNQKNENENNISIPCKAIRDLQERLKSLEKENEELSFQLKRFATMSDTSLIHSKQHFSQPQESVISNSMVSTSNNQAVSINFSENNQSGNLFWEKKYNEQISINEKLMKELQYEKEKNKKLEKQQQNILSTVTSITNLCKKEGKDDFTNIEEALFFMSNCYMACKSQRDQVNHLHFELSDQKQKINEILNSFKNEFLNLRLLTMNQLGKSAQNNFGKSNGSAQLNINSDPLIIRGCEEIINAISVNFGGVQKIPLKDISNNPKEFGKYINLIRSHLDMNIQSLKNENRNLKNDLSNANNKVKAATVSSDIQNAIKNVMSTINKATKLMHDEHNELIAQLA